MNRLIIPFLIAAVVHLAFIRGEFDFFKKEPVVAPEITFMTMTLAHVEAPQPEKKPQKKIVKKTKKVPPKKTKKKSVQKEKELPKQKIVNKTQEKEVLEKEKETSEEPEETKAAVAQIKKASPLYSHNPSPRYPRSARQRGWQGLVEIEAVVDIYGNVKTLKIVKSSGYSILDKSALKTVKGWRFSPGKQGSNPVETAVIVPVRFSLS